MKTISKAGFIATLKKTNGSVARVGKQSLSGKRFLRLMMAGAVTMFCLSMNLVIASNSTVDRWQGQQNPPTTGEPPANKGGSTGALDNRTGARNGSNIILNPDEEYRIGPNDLIEVKIDKAEELSGNFLVSKSGAFTMRFLGSVMAQGKTSDQLAAQIADGLRGRYLVDPNVRVTVLQPSGQAFYVQGAVRNPGLFQIQGRPTLLELITIAGGLAENHGSTAFLIRKVKPSQAAIAVKASAPAEPTAADQNGEPEVAQFEMVKASITGLFKGNFNNNLMVEPGDIITIPVSDVFFIAGEVRAPGSFPLKDGMTLRQAILLAQGTTPKAKSGDTTIYREDGVTGKRQEIKVDIGAVMSGKKEDILLMANDVIQVPNSRLKSFGSSVLSTFGYSAVRLIRY
jgi:polysaccharide export outer membrane protein